MTSAQLASELEVAQRTILRDVDALTEAGLPIIVHRGNQGGIELGFNYRTRLTGLAEDEAEALAILLARPLGPLADLGIRDAVNRMRQKIVESFPDLVRERMKLADDRFRFGRDTEGAAVGRGSEERVAALAKAVRNSNIVRLQAKSSDPRTIHPIALMLSGDGWCLLDQRTPAEPIAEENWGDINISARRFALSDNDE